MTYQEKITKFQNIPVTLNGQPARIMGFRLRFGWVADNSPHGQKVEFAWETIAHIVENKNGKFKS